VIWFITVVVIAWLAGVAFGATIFVDWLHGPRAERRQSLPLARVITRAEDRRLDIPTVRRVVFGKGAVPRG
jgi:hypothetical protein